MGESGAISGALKRKFNKSPIFFMVILFQPSRFVEGCGKECALC
jgi:hypothetical protein